MKIKSFINLSLVLSISTFMVACGETTSISKDEATPAPSTSSKTSETVTFTKTDVKVGDGAEAKAGQSVSVHYTGWLYEPNSPKSHGKKFDSSRDRNQAFVFPLGAGRVIKGWDQGVVGMKVGGQRTLIIPSDMAYGSRGAGGTIPPNATLIFDVELIEVK
ncbi:MAG: FKBP-type peptidyl-prolyl cis-trans isomerase [Cocleimonas sp.]|nr:FKBP-type peptidyl-prolyl cis-trans isomerase [Cocleimonas sp.]MCK5896231.1 FKBP-type peptidyl-prolyl cis-trans isomerase [Cocleimonas sp.]